MKRYIIKGDPIPLARPRLSRGHLYYAQQHQRDIIKEELTRQHGSLPFYSGPVVLSVTFYLGLPAVKKKYNEGDPHLTRPDLSNLIKMVEDAGKDILYKDDATISCIIARKLYAEVPRTEFTLEVVSYEEA